MINPYSVRHYGYIAPTPTSATFCILLLQKYDVNNEKRRHLKVYSLTPSGSCFFGPQSTPSSCEDSEVVDVISVDFIVMYGTRNNNLCSLDYTRVYRWRVFHYVILCIPIQCTVYYKNVRPNKKFIDYL